MCRSASEKSDFVVLRVRIAAAVNRALFRHCVSAFELIEQLPGFERTKPATLCNPRDAVFDMRGQRADVVAHVAEHLADAILKLQLHHRLRDFILDARTLRAQDAAGLDQPFGDLAEIIEHRADGLFGARYRFRFARRGVIGRAHRGTDRVADRFYFGTDARAGCLRQIGQLAHFIGHHREAAPDFTGARCLDGGIEGQQIGLVGDAGDIDRHLFQFDDEVEQAADFAEHDLFVVHGRLQRRHDFAQLRLAAGEYRYRRTGAVELAGGGFGSGHRGFKIAHDAGKLPGEFADRTFHLRATELDLTLPYRHHFVAELFERGYERAHAIDIVLFGAALSLCHRFRDRVFMHAIEQDSAHRERDQRHDRARDRQPAKAGDDENTD